MNFIYSLHFLNGSLSVRYKHTYLSSSIVVVKHPMGLLVLQHFVSVESSSLLQHSSRLVIHLFAMIFH